ncbi:MAG: hypothetical protein OTI35_09645, partial [Sulfitobacter sp.]|nr:hypothetical protein [Sulfitobacter sp.]
MPNYKTKVDKTLRSKDFVDPELAGNSLIGVDRNTHTIALERPQNSDATIYYGALKIASHLPALGFVLEIIEADAELGVKDQQYVAKVTKLPFSSPIERVDLKWFAYNDGFLSEPNHLIGSIEFGRIELVLSFYQVKIYSAPDEWLCILFIKDR